MRTGWKEIKGRGRWVAIWQHKTYGNVSLNACRNGSWFIASKALAEEGNPRGMIIHYTEVGRKVCELQTAMLMAENYARKLEAVPMVSNPVKA